MFLILAFFALTESLKRPVKMRKAFIPNDSVDILRQMRHKSYLTEGIIKNI